jgi:hypothetical protein
VFNYHSMDGRVSEYLEHSPAMTVQTGADFLDYINNPQLPCGCEFAETSKLPVSIAFLVGILYAGVQDSSTLNIRNSRMHYNSPGR